MATISKLRQETTATEDLICDQAEMIATDEQIAAGYPIAFKLMQRFLKDEDLKTVNDVPVLAGGSAAYYGALMYALGAAESVRER